MCEGSECEREGSGASAHLGSVPGTTMPSTASRPARLTRSRRRGVHLKHLSPSPAAADLLLLRVRFCVSRPSAGSLGAGCVSGKG